jgi:hypothetical protein
VGCERRHDHLARIDHTEHGNLDDSQYNAERAAYGSLSAHGHRLGLVELERSVRAVGGQPLRHRGGAERRRP